MLLILQNIRDAAGKERKGQGGCRKIHFASVLANDSVVADCMWLRSLFFFFFFFNFSVARC